MFRWNSFWAIIIIAAVATGQILAANASQPSSKQQFNIGVSTHFAQRKGDIGADMAAIKYLGFGYFRDEIYWQSVQTESGVFGIPPQLREYDTMLLRNSKGLKPLLVLTYGHSKFSPNGMPITENEIFAFGRYVNYISKRYKGKVLGYQVWNEWNKGAGSPNRQGPKDVSSYTKLLKHVSAIIRENDPDAIIIAGAAAGRDESWLLELASVPGYNAIADAISMHPYNFCDGKNSTPESSIRWLQQFSDNLTKTTGVRTQIYVTEIGWPTSENRCGMQQEKLGSYLSRYILVAPMVPMLKGVFFYDFRNDGTDPNDIEHNFGLALHNGKLKRGMEIFPKIRKEIIDSKNLSINISANAITSTWQRNTGELDTFIWTENGKMDSVVFQVPCPQSSANGIDTEITIYNPLEESKMHPATSSLKSGQCNFSVNINGTPTQITHTKKIELAR